MPLRLKQKPRPWAAPKASRPPSRKWLWIWTVVLLILGAWAAVFNFPSAWNRAIAVLNERTALELARWHPRPFRLGLDLLGGTELVYEANLAQIAEGERDDAMRGVRDVIERRVNALGVAEPVVQVVRTSGTYRVIVQLAGVRDVNEAIREIGETPVLEFKEEGVADPVVEAAYEEELAQIRERVDEIQARARELGTPSLDRLAQEFGLEAQELGFIGQELYPELWVWANENGVGKQTREAIETYTGWHFIYVRDVREAGTEIEASHILICFAGAVRCDRDTTEEEARALIDDLRSRATPDNFADLARENSTEGVAPNTGGSLGWFPRGRMVKSFEDPAFALAVGQITEVVQTEFGYQIIYKTGERPLNEYDVQGLEVRKPEPPIAEQWTNTGLSGKHLARARVEFDQNTNAPIVALTFNSEGKDLFGDITARNVNKQIAIFLDGSAISAPVVQTEIRGGDAIITGDFTIDEAKTLAQRLNAGALPVPISLVSQQTVGAILGQDSLAKSLVAGLIGFVLVALFMIVYYRVPGVIAVISLAIYTAFVLALFKLIPVTLSLAGIAGFILSLGMAVDANVLIFERMKEELHAGRSLSSAIDEGFRRAWTSIRDGNFTTLIAALVLFWFSSSVIKGFALTLGIGVLVSMFSALTITRVFLQVIAGWRWREKLGLFAIMGRRQ